jgi:phospholipid-binding lipoprotein MlaA
MNSRICKEYVQEVWLACQIVVAISLLCLLTICALTPVRVNAAEGLEEGMVSVQTGGVSPTNEPQGSSEEYGDVTQEETGTAGPEEPTMADPIEPWNRAMYHFNDKFYFWLVKPTTKGYMYIIPEGLRVAFNNFYENIKAPIRIVNNLLQGKPRYAGLELGRFFINSTIGAAGFRDCAKECFGITGRYADFGQTLGKYGVGFGFYIVWPVLGPSSPRDTVGWAADWLLKPTSYISTQWISVESVGLYVHETINYTSFHIGDYEGVKQAALDPYVSIRDGYVQYRKKLVEQNGAASSQE